eukprot:Clim_evm35s204 gene=Clim_evmTU35s204
MASNTIDDQEALSKGLTVFVRNLNYHVTSAELEEIFSEVGAVRRCFVIHDEKTKNTAQPLNRGFGYVTYAFKEDADNAVKELQSKEIRGRKVHLMVAKPAQPGRKVKTHDNQTDAETGDHTVGSHEQGEPPEASKAPPEAYTLVQKDVKETGRATAQKDPERELLSRSVYISGFPADVTQKVLYKKVRKIADVAKVTMEKEHGYKGNADSSLATAVVEYEEPYRAHLAEKKLNRHIFKGQMIHAHVMSRHAKARAAELKEARLIIRNLSFTVTPERLEEKFREAVPGAPLSEPINMPTDAKGKRRGFGFVQFMCISHAKQAMDALNAQEIAGRPIAVDWCIKREDYEKEQQQTEMDAAPEDNLVEADVQDDGKGDDPKEEGEQKTKPAKEAPKRIDPKTMTDANDGKTLFVRNISFEADEAQLKTCFEKFGDVKDVKIVIDQRTGLPKGSAFVKFKRKSSAKECVAQSNAESDAYRSGKAMGHNATKGGKGGSYFGVGADEALGDDAQTTAADDGPAEGPFFVAGRRVYVSYAVSRDRVDDVIQKRNETQALGGDKDKRNLHLAVEGHIDPEGLEAKGLSEQDLSRRQRYDAERLRKLKDPNFHINPLRIVVRNIPKDQGENDGLSKHFMDVIFDKTERRVRFAKLNHFRERTSAEAPLVSKGFAFVNFNKHEDALTALRALNNNPKVFGPQQRPIVEFSVEDVRKMRLHEARVQRLQRKQNQSVGEGPEMEIPLDDDTNAQKRKDKAKTAKKSRSERRRERRERTRQQKASEDDQQAEQPQRQQQQNGTSQAWAKHEKPLLGDVKARQEAKANQRSAKQRRGAKVAVSTAGATVGSGSIVSHEEREFAAALEGAELVVDGTHSALLDKQRQKKLKRKREATDNFDASVANYRQKIAAASTNKWM